jgi:iron complex outermembrane receptor protein
MYRLQHCLLFFTLLMLVCASVAAQPPVVQGILSGTLKDQNGAVVQRGVVVVKSLDSGATVSVQTDQEGRYLLNSLPVGRYRVSASFEGFLTTVRNDVSVSEKQSAVVDFVLSVHPKDITVVVTAPATTRPLVVETDPRAPRQPIPAQDGAEYLKSIPGFSIIRKGGTDGDPTLRGMAGSRLNFLLDGQQILGGCGGRMDPPTAYVFPDVYKRITVMKGPQTVLYGPGASAGTVLFERERKRAELAGIALDGAGTIGSYGRFDEMIDGRASIPNGYVQGIITRSHSDDYRDGDGTAIHSFYTKWSSSAEMGWTPGADTYLALSFLKSDGEAAYADRTVDGSKFARDTWSVRFDKQHVSPLVDRIEAQVFYNYIDHIMDNYSLRTPGMMLSAMNPDRKTMGGRAAATLSVSKTTTFVIGLDSQRNIHRGRSVMGGMSADQVTNALYSAPRAEDMKFEQVGVFGEITQLVGLRSRLIGGVRSDWHKTTDSRMCVNAMMCPGASASKNDTMGASDDKTLVSGFGRYELDLRAGNTFYIGVGHAERSPDYWERQYRDPVTLKSAFLSTKPEKTTQLDAGMLWRSDALSGSVSGFYGKVNDYILIRWNPSPVLTRNIDATTMGAEGDVAYRIMENLKANATLAYVRSNNDTDNKPLAQQPPLETTIGLNYNNHVYSFGALARLVGAQTRVDVGSGNIVANGMDLGSAAGFSVFSVNGGYRLKKMLLVSGGIDNLLGKIYAEHLSKSDAAVPGFIGLSHLHEPGRAFWLKANFMLPGSGF